MLNKIEQYKIQMWRNQDTHGYVDRMSTYDYTACKQKSSSAGKDGTAFCIFRWYYFYCAGGASVCCGSVAGWSAGVLVAAAAVVSSAGSVSGGAVVSGSGLYA